MPDPNHPPSATGRPLPRPEFPPTSWSLVVGAASAGGGSSEALERLCRSYWAPLYAWIRRQGHAREDAEDLTQGYFIDLLGRGYLAAADCRKGRFRSFLLADLKLFLSSRQRLALAKKRGAGRAALPLEKNLDEEAGLSSGTLRERPDSSFDRDWTLSTLRRTLERLEAEQNRKGESLLYRRLKPHLSWQAGEMSQAQLAEECGLSLSDVKVRIHRLRRRFRDLLREEVAETLADSSEVDSEIAQLILSLEGETPL